MTEVPIKSMDWLQYDRDLRHEQVKALNFHWYMFPFLHLVQSANTEFLVIEENKKEQIKQM